MILYRSLGIFIILLVLSVSRTWYQILYITVLSVSSVSARNYFTSLYDLPNSSTTPWQRFSLGLLLMFFIVFTYYVTNNTFHKWTGTSATAIGAVYFACGLVAVRANPMIPYKYTTSKFLQMPFINPACAFGPALVMNHWDNHWVSSINFNYY
jgi:hypothetical protein